MKTLLNIAIMLLSMLLLGIVLTSCKSSSTEITGTWHNPVTKKEYHNILVAALTGSTNTKSTVEEDLVESLRTKGISATRSIDVLPPQFIEDDNQKRKIISKIRDDGSDAILTISLLDKETETRYVPGNYTYSPFPTYGYYGTFWGYYNYWYPRVQSSGYYVEDKVYFIETNLYDSETEELIWSAQSETYNPMSLDAFSEEFAQEICTSLDRDNII